MSQQTKCEKKSLPTSLPHLPEINLVVAIGPQSNPGDFIRAPDPRDTSRIYKTSVPEGTRPGETFVYTTRAKRPVEKAKGDVVAKRPKCDRTALNQYQKAAAEGHAQSQHQLGRMFQSGVGAGKNRKKAVLWYTKAAEAGFAPGMHALGNCYDEGEGVKKDLSIAAHWHTKAAALGHAPSEQWLGRKFVHFDVDCLDGKTVENVRVPTTSEVRRPGFGYEENNVWGIKLQIAARTGIPVDEIALSGMLHAQGQGQAQGHEKREGGESVAEMTQLFNSMSAKSVHRRMKGRGGDTGADDHTATSSRNATAATAAAARPVLSLVRTTTLFSDSALCFKAQLQGIAPPETRVRFGYYSGSRYKDVYLDPTPGKGRAYANWYAGGWRPPTCWSARCEAELARLYKFSKWWAEHDDDSDI